MVPPPSNDPGPGEREGGTPASASWPRHFPHREIDALVDRLQSGQSLDRADAYLLLSSVAKEAQRLRTTTMRLATAKLGEADETAREIVARAHQQADALRRNGLEVLNARLDEAERLLATLREAFMVEQRAADLARLEGSLTALSSFPTDLGDPAGPSDAGDPDRPDGDLR